MKATKLLMVRPRRPVRDVAPLLPPLKLYRRILRAHRKYLDPTQRKLGDMYVKSEFHLHKSTDNPLYIVGFLSSWQKYVENIEGKNWVEEKLDMDTLSKMSDEQIVQLYELMKASKGLPEDAEIETAVEEGADKAVEEEKGKAEK